MSHNETGSNGPGALGEEAVDGNAAYGLQAATQDSFGFEKIDSAQRQSRVNAVFRRVAERYDLMNDLMSGGLHRLWKRDLISWLAPPRGEQPFTLLDVAGGTADIALQYLDVAGGGSRAIVCDISREMLNAGRGKIAAADRQDQIWLVQGNAEQLPFPDRSMEAYTIAFGIRNVTHIDRALAEAYRVLKPGGRFLCLEFSQVQVPVLDALYDLYSMKVIPELGQLAAGDRASYQYLVESIRQFPNQERFKSLIEQAGFAAVKYRNLSGGIAAIHSGWKI